MLLLMTHNFRHASNRPIHLDEWYSKFLVLGQLEKVPLSSLCGVHRSLCVYGWKEATQKKRLGYVHLNISALPSPFSYALRLEYPFYVFVRPGGFHSIIQRH